MVDKRKIAQIANEMLKEQKEHVEKWRPIRERMTQEEQRFFDEYSSAAVVPNLTEEEREQALYLRDWATLDMDNTLLEMKEEIKEYLPEGWE